ncbi:hypothetical protein thsrh120_62850 [Rhizobium sp. No.120]
MNEKEIDIIQLESRLRQRSDAVPMVPRIMPHLGHEHVPPSDAGCNERRTDKGFVFIHGGRIDMAKIKLDSSFDRRLRQSTWQAKCTQAQSRECQRFVTGFYP